MNYQYSMNYKYISFKDIKNKQFELPRYDYNLF